MTLYTTYCVDFKWRLKECKISNYSTWHVGRLSWSVKHDDPLCYVPGNYLCILMFVQMILNELHNYSFKLSFTNFLKTHCEINWKSIEMVYFCAQHNQYILNCSWLPIVHCNIVTWLWRCDGSITLLLCWYSVTRNPWTWRQY